MLSTIEERQEQGTEQPAGDADRRRLQHSAPEDSQIEWSVVGEQKREPRASALLRQPGGEPVK